MWTHHHIQNHNKNKRNISWIWFHHSNEFCAMNQSNKSSSSVKSFVPRHSTPKSKLISTLVRPIIGFWLQWLTQFPVSVDFDSNTVRTQYSICTLFALDVNSYDQTESHKHRRWEQSKEIIACRIVWHKQSNIHFRCQFNLKHTRPLTHFFRNRLQKY